jgi:hypothetical protein
VELFAYFQYINGDTIWFYILRCELKWMQYLKRESIICLKKKSNLSAVLGRGSGMGSFFAWTSWESDAAMTTKTRARRHQETLFASVTQSTTYHRVPLGRVVDGNRSGDATGLGVLDLVTTSSKFDEEDTNSSEQHSSSKAIVSEELSYLVLFFFFFFRF